MEPLKTLSDICFYSSLGHHWEPEETHEYMKSLEALLNCNDNVLYFGKILKNRATAI